MFFVPPAGVFLTWSISILRIAFSDKAGWDDRVMVGNEQDESLSEAEVFAHLESPWSLGLQSSQAKAGWER
jgi:hypothetical protein